jgi:hypothetical protein
MEGAEKEAWAKFEAASPDVSEEVTEAPVSESPKAPVGEPEGQTAEELFFDATQVEERLQPTLRAMQAAWTKKIQEEVVPYRKIAEAVGGPEELQRFVEIFQDPDQSFNWWVQYGLSVGIPEETMMSLFEEGQAPEGEAPQVQPQAAPTAGAQPQGGQPPTQAPIGDYLTRDELYELLEQYDQFQSERQQEQVQTAEQQKQIDAKLSSLGVSQDEVKMVKFLAGQHPFELGYEKRLDMGYKDYQAMLSRGGQPGAAKPTQPAPKVFGGSSPVEGEETSASLEEATKNFIRVHGIS